MRMTNEELVEKIQSGEDVESNMGLLYQQNRRLIYKFALPYSDMADMDDLMQEAYFGLVKAVEKYDPEKEFKFITYAEWNIRGHLQRYCYNFGKNRRIPVHMIERMSKYHDVIRKYENDYGEKPSDEYIKKELQINTNQLKVIRKTILTCNTISFDDIVPGTDATFGETIADETDFQEEIVQKMAEEQVNSSVWKSVDELPSKMKDIIHLRYENGLSQKSVAENLGISAERIRQYEHRAYQLLKAKEAIQRAAEFYDCNHNSMLYHDTLSFYKNHGMSAIEYMVIKKEEIEEKKNKVNQLLDDMVWEV